jgi:hypothetical protein
MSTSSGVICDIICAEWRNSSTNKKDNKNYALYSNGVANRPVNATNKNKLRGL